MKEIWLAIQKFLKGADLLLLFLCLCCSGFSMIVLSSVTLTFKDGPDRYLLIQGVATGLGVLVFLLLTLIDMEWLASRWPLLLAFSVGLMLLLFPFGKAGDTGNRSWLFIPGMPTGIQPAEIVKITFIIMLAKQMYALRDRISHVGSVVFLVAHVGFMAALIIVTSYDDGMVLVYLSIFIFMCIASGLKVRWFAVAAAVAGVSIPIIWSQFLSNYQRNRILIVFNPDLDPQGVGWQTNKSKTAIGAGKLLGQGLGQGQQAQYGNFPQKHNDFIFSMIGEELGFLGCVAVILLLSLIIFRCLFVAARGKSGLSSLICVGVAGMMILQTFLNIGMCMGIVPVVGLTLPFFSYGGSSTLTMYAAMGLVSSVRMHPMPEWQKRQELTRSRGEPR